MDQCDCQNQQRREWIRQVTGKTGRPVVNGIDFIEIESPDQKRLAVRFVHSLPGEPNGVPEGPVLTKDNVVIEGGVRVRNIRVVGVSAKGRTLSVTVDRPGDFSRYRLRLVSPGGNHPPEGFDPILSGTTFSFKAGCPSEFDCRATAIPSLPEGSVGPVLDYQCKDYSSFRRLMIDRLAISLPGWQDHPADVVTAVVETMAFAADHLSYYQDAVATEAYLGTARRRISIRRHARLLDYPMHDGCNARTFVQFQVDENGVTLAGGTPLFTRVIGLGTRIVPDSALYRQALSSNAGVLATMHPVKLYRAHNEIIFYGWGAEDGSLSKGATKAAFRSSRIEPLALRAGDILVLEEVRGAGGQVPDADPAHRHAVRLTKVTHECDPLVLDGDGLPLPVCSVEWNPEDALPFALSLRDVPDPADPRRKVPATVARGNIALVDHGRMIGWDIPVRIEAPVAGRFRPSLPYGPVTHAAPYDHTDMQSAAVALRQNASLALPIVCLREEDGDEWVARHDLLASDRFARDFVVETGEDGVSVLRFGDGVSGKRPAPGKRFYLSYRIGNGIAGNVGAEAIAHAVTACEVKAVRNLLPACGGTEPESCEQVRFMAPSSFHDQERAVTGRDYAAAAERHPQVQKAVATRRWTGSWPTFFITVDRRGGLPVNGSFEKEMRAFLERFRLAGHDIEIEPPRFVPLDIVLRVRVSSDQYRDYVKEALLETFGTGLLAGGRTGFFHPDCYTFGEPVYLSQVVSRAMGVPGVEWVLVETFKRWGELDRGEREEGRIGMGRLEIARLDNDPNFPENGRMEFRMEGGL